MRSQSPRTILELILGTGSRSPPKQERPYLILEDLLDDPIEWALSEGARPPTLLKGNQTQMFTLH